MITVALLKKFTCNLSIAIIEITDTATSYIKAFYNELGDVQPI